MWNEPDIGGSETILILVARKIEKVWKFVVKEILDVLLERGGGGGSDYSVWINWIIISAKKKNSAAKAILGA